MNFKKSKAIFFENSWVPKVLSLVSPIEVGAITLGPFVFCRGKVSDITRNHENIHWQQYIETGIIGFIILYLVFWLIGLYKFRDGAFAYHWIPFEREAYANDANANYLKDRKRYNWIKYLKRNSWIT